MERIKVVIEVDNRSVTFEVPPEVISGEASGITISGTDQGKVQVNERAFYEAKNPGNHAESVAVFGFWLAERGHKEFNETDIRRLYLRAGIRPPKVVAQALRDAKNRFDFLEPGATRGAFRLTDYGDRTVRFDLPRG